MSGSCAVCVDRVVYLFGGHHARGNTNKVSNLKVNPFSQISVSSLAFVPIFYKLEVAFSVS